MAKVSIIVLTKNRPELLRQALLSVKRQTFYDYKIIVINDGSTDETKEVLKDLKLKDLKIITHEKSVGIIESRMEALLNSAGEYVAVLDDDDEWVDLNKLKKQVEFLDSHPDYVIVGGGIEIQRLKDLKIERFRPQADGKIRKTMLLRNNFFTSTVMFRRQAAIDAGGFIKDNIDLGEDYDLWLRMGKLGKMYNFLEVFTAYRPSSYNKEKFGQFLQKQLNLISQHKKDYPYYLPAFIILKLRQVANL